MLPFTLQQLRILKAIATEKNFTKAAEVLYVSQPSLSKQIKTLEKNLDILLINRESNRISLTENGKVFLQYSERILALCEESCRALIDLKNGDRGNLTVGASQTIGTYLMPRVLALFAQNHPQIDLKVQVNSTRIISKNVINREIDIAVVGGEIPDELRKNLTIEHFVEDELSLIISKSHPFVTKKKINKDDLYHLNFITLNSNSTIRKFIDNILTKITLPGSIFLAIVAILPAFVSAWGVSGNFAQFFGGTSLLIIVGVALDTLQQIESHLLMRHYDGFMKSGKIKGRR